MAARRLRAPQPGRRARRSGDVAGRLVSRRRGRHVDAEHARHCCGAHLHSRSLERSSSGSVAASRAGFRSASTVARSEQWRMRSSMSTAMFRSPRLRLTAGWHKIDITYPQPDIWLPGTGDNRDTRCFRRSCCSRSHSPPTRMLTVARATQQRCAGGRSTGSRSWCRRNQSTSRTVTMPNHVVC